MKQSTYIKLYFILLVLLQGCLSTRLVKHVYKPDKLDSISSRETLKIHLKDGGLYVLNSWTENKSGDTIAGFGKLYNDQRSLLQQRVEIHNSKIITPFLIPENEITLIETSKLEGHNGNLLAMSIVGVPFSLISAYCVINPKACFGSCPTFYAQKNHRWVMMAEGFSSSISPSFEKRDIDMLYGADDTGPDFSLRLTNEALETHVIRYVDLLLFPKSEGETVFAAENGAFFRTGQVDVPKQCRSEEGDFRTQILALDGTERNTPADPENLARKEELFITFDNNDMTRKGLIIAARQTLLTTHLFYQQIAYTGSQYGAIVSALENGDEKLKKRIEKIWDKLGGIEIFIETGSKWQEIEEFSEMGPIASDVHLVNLPPCQGKEIRLKIRLTKGLWRIDYLGLASITSEEVPIRIKPFIVLNGDSADVKALGHLTSEVSPLVTLPGDRYELRYHLPDNCRYQYFLDTKGYYLEWMRENWLKEENLKKAAVALYFPGLFLRRSAAEYKKVEPQMEKVFWDSRYVKQ